MKELFEKLAALADQLDRIEAPEIADEVDTLMRDLREEAGRLAAEEETYMTICDKCLGSGEGEDAPWCDKCKGEGFIKGASLAKTALKPPYVRRRGNKWVVLDKHNGKVLSEHDTEEKAKGSLKAMHARKG